jgi:glycosyltransferase involved in cell wall biosynthesis
VPTAKTIAVVMPAHNEAAVLGSVLAKMPARIDGYSVLVIVVDDGSSDSTADIAHEKGAFVLQHVANLGVGAATITGLKAAQRLNADVIVTMDSDGQHDPADIQALVDCLIDGSFDVVIGSRLVDPGGMPPTRIAANLLLNALTFVAYGKIVSDSQSGFKALSREALAKLDLKSVGYGICSEFVGEIYSKNLSYKSLPIKPVYTRYSRAKGQPFLNGINLILDLLVRLVRRV